MPKLNLVSTRVISSISELAEFKRTATAAVLSFAASRKFDIEKAGAVLQARYAEMEQALVDGFVVETEVDVLPEPSTRDYAITADRVELAASALSAAETIGTEQAASLAEQALNTATPVAVIARISAALNLLLRPAAAGDKLPSIDEFIDKARQDKTLVSLIKEFNDVVQAADAKSRGVVTVTPLTLDEVATAMYDRAAYEGTLGQTEVQPSAINELAPLLTDDLAASNRAVIPYNVATDPDLRKVYEQVKQDMYREAEEAVSAQRHQLLTKKTEIEKIVGKAEEGKTVRFKPGEGDAMQRARADLQNIIEEMRRLVVVYPTGKQILDRAIQQLGIPDEDVKRWTALSAFELLKGGQVASRRNDPEAAKAREAEFEAAKDQILETLVAGDKVSYLRDAIGQIRRSVPTLFKPSDWKGWIKLLRLTEAQADTVYRAVANAATADAAALAATEALTAIGGAVPAGLEADFSKVISDLYAATRGDSPKSTAPTTDTSTEITLRGMPPVASPRAVTPQGMFAGLWDKVVALAPAGAVTDDTQAPELAALVRSLSKITKAAGADFWLEALRSKQGVEAMCAATGFSSDQLRANSLHVADLYVPMPTGQEIAGIAGYTAQRLADILAAGDKDKVSEIAEYLINEFYRPTMESTSKGGDLFYAGDLWDKVLERIPATTILAKTYANVLGADYDKDVKEYVRAELGKTLVPNISDSLINKVVAEARNFTAAGGGKGAAVHTQAIGHVIDTLVEELPPEGSETAAESHAAPEAEQAGDLRWQDWIKKLELDREQAEALVAAVAISVSEDDAIASVDDLLVGWDTEFPKDFNYAAFRAAVRSLYLGMPHDEPLGEVESGQGDEQNPDADEQGPGTPRNPVGGSWLLTATDDRIPGGVAAGRPNTDFDPMQMALGKKVEMEHVKGSDLPAPVKAEVAEEIAKDHLAEAEEWKDPKYYTNLKKMEDKSKRGSWLHPI